MILHNCARLSQPERNTTMKMHVLPLACLLFVCTTRAEAQVSLHLDIRLPAAPPLVLIQPGIQVVEGFPEEVFLHSGWYWCRRSDGWYRARSPRAQFDWVEVRRVPPTLIRVPEGHYRNWHRGDRRHNEDWKAERREERQDRKYWKKEEKQERKERKQERREDRKEGKHGERSEGEEHGHHAS